MSALQKLRGFAFPIANLVASTLAGMGWMYWQSHPVACVPLAVITIGGGGIGIIMTIVDAVKVVEDGWEELAGRCHRCKRLEDENRSLLEAIK